MDSDESSQHHTEVPTAVSEKPTSEASAGFDPTSTEDSLAGEHEGPPEKPRWWKMEFPTSSDGGESVKQVNNELVGPHEDAQVTAPSAPLYNARGSGGPSSSTKSSSSSHDNAIGESSDFSSQRSEPNGEGDLTMEDIFQDLVPKVNELVAQRLEELNVSLNEEARQRLAEQLLTGTLKPYIGNNSTSQSGSEQERAPVALQVGEEYDRAREIREQQVSKRLTSVKINRFGKERAVSWRTGRGPDGETLTDPSSAGLIEAADAADESRNLARRTKENDPAPGEDWRQAPVLSASLPPSIGDNSEKAEGLPPNKPLPAINPRHELIIGAHLMPAVIALGCERLRQSEIRKARDQAKIAFQKAEKCQSLPLMGRCAYYLGVAHYASNDHTIKNQAHGYFRFAAEHAHGYFPEAGRAQQWINHLDNSGLPEQSPPGSAKSWTWDFAQGGKAFAGKTLGWLYGGNKSKGGEASQVEEDIRPRPRPKHRGAPLLEGVVPRRRRPSSVASSRRGLGERIPSFASVETFTERTIAEETVAEGTDPKDPVHEGIVPEELNAETNAEENSPEHKHEKLIADHTVQEGTNPQEDIVPEGIGPEETQSTITDEGTMQSKLAPALGQAESGHQQSSSNVSDSTPELSNDSMSETAVNSDNYELKSVGSLLGKFDVMDLKPSEPQEPSSEIGSISQPHDAVTVSLAPTQSSIEPPDEDFNDEPAASNEQLTSPAPDQADPSTLEPTTPSKRKKKRDMRMFFAEQRYKDRTDKPAKLEGAELAATLRMSYAIAGMRPRQASDAYGGSSGSASRKSSLDPPAAMLMSHVDETRRRQSSDAGSGEAYRKGSFASG